MAERACKKSNVRECVSMEELWREREAAGGPEEIVLTLRPQEAEPVELRYERDLPECMRAAPEEEAGDRVQPPGPLNPPERPRKRWGVRLYVGISLLLIVVCLGVGIWYVGQYGWALPGRGLPEYRDEIRPGGEEYYYWEETELEDASISIPTYPTGGEIRLHLSSAAGLPLLTIQEVYDKVTPSVVAVLGQEDRISNVVSVGTGVIFSADGYILTNCHVIAGCSSCAVWVTNEYGVDDMYEAKVVSYDADRDLAVLKVEAENLPAAEFGVSDDLVVGEPVYAIGNPLGVELRNTLTNGIVSAINRDVDVDGVQMTMIQTTAALNSGNSGGPLINQYGQVIGINTIKMMSRYNTIEGLGFAIPSSLALRWVNELIEFGEIQPQPVLGVTVNRIPEMLPDGRTGLRLEGVTEGGSGDRAGLRTGDCLVSFAGQEVLSYEQLLAIRRELKVGDEVAVQVYRDGVYLDMTMIMMAE